MCKKSRRIMEFKYFYFEKYTEYYDFPAKTEDGSYLISQLLSPSGSNKEENHKYMVVQSWH